MRLGTRKQLGLVLVFVLWSATAWAQTTDIYTVTKPLHVDGGVVFHSFTVWTSDKGQTWTAFRGGPTGGDPNVPQISSKSLIDTVTGNPRTFGKLEMTVQPWDFRHIDYPADAGPGGLSGWGVNESGGFVRGGWSAIQIASGAADPTPIAMSVRDTINAFSADYNTPLNNSNTGNYLFLNRLGSEIPVTVKLPLNTFEFAPGWGKTLSQRMVLGLPSGDTYDGFTVTSAPLASPPTVPATPPVPQVISEPPAPPGIVPTPVVPTVPQTVAVDTDVWGVLCIVTCREIHNLTPEQEAALLALGGTVVQPSRGGQPPVVQTTTIPLVTFPVVTPLPVPGTGTPVFLPGTVVIPSVEVGQLVDPVTGLPYGDPGGTVTFPPFFTPVFTDFGNIKLPEGGFGFGPFSMMSSAMITNPEPATWLLMGSGLAVLLLWRRKAGAGRLA